MLASFLFHLMSENRCAEVEHFYQTAVKVWHIEPSSMYYWARVFSKIKLRDYAGVQKVYEEMSSFGIEVPEVRSYDVIIEAMIFDNKIEQALDVFKIMIKKKIVPTNYMIHMFVRYYCQQGSIENSLKWFALYKKFHLTPQPHSLSCVLALLISQQKYQPVLDVLETFQNPNYFPSHQIHQLVRDIIQVPSIDEELKKNILDIIQPHFDHYLDIFVTYECEKNNISGALNYIDMYKSKSNRHVPPHVCEYLLSRLSENDDASLMILKELIMSSAPKQVILDNVIAKAIQKGKINEAYDVYLLCSYNHNMKPSEEIQKELKGQHESLKTK